MISLFFKFNLIRGISHRQSVGKYSFDISLKALINLNIVELCLLSTQKIHVSVNKRLHFRFFHF